VSHESWPEQAEFERQNGSGNRAGRKKNGEPFASGLRDIVVNYFPRLQIIIMRDGHKEWHYHPDAGEYYMKIHRQSHLRTGCNEIIHSF